MEIAEKLPALQLKERAGNFLTKALQGESWNGLCRKIRETVHDIANSDIELLIRSYYAPIRSLNELDAKLQLTIEIEYCARNYGARSSDNIENIMVECIDLVTKRFVNLAIEEIRMAFQLKAAGIIKPKGAEMYGGGFNVEVLGKILTAYREWRAEVLRPIFQILEEIRQNEIDEEKKRVFKESYERHFDEILSGYRHKYTVDNLANVPVGLYDRCKKLGYFQLDKAAGMDYFERAKKLVDMEFSVEVETNRSMLNRAINISPEDRAKTIARKLVLLELVLNNDNCIAWKN